MYPSWRILKIQLLQLLHCKINHHWATPWWKIGKTNRGRQQHLEWPKLWCQGSCTIATSISGPIGLMKEKCFANPFQNEWEVGLGGRSHVWRTWFGATLPPPVLPRMPNKHVWIHMISIWIMNIIIWIMMISILWEFCSIDPDFGLQLFWFDFVKRKLIS